MTINMAQLLRIFPRDIANQIHTVSTTANTAQSTATTAQTTATTAQTTADESGSYGVWNPPSVVWTASSAGVYPAGNPSSSAVLTVYNKSGTSIATRTVTGTLTSASGVVNVATGSGTGLTTSVSYVDNGSKSVRADVTVTFASGSKTVFSVGFSSVDPSVASTTPATGGGK